MGDEYEGALEAELGDEVIAKVLETLAKDWRWQVVRRSPNSLALADAGQKLNPKWPERITVVIDPKKVYCRFDAGPEFDFLELLTTTLERHGIDCTLIDLSG